MDTTKKILVIGVFLLLSVAAAAGQWTRPKVDPQETDRIKGDLQVEGFADFKSPTLKLHNNRTIDTTNTDWNNVSFNVHVPSESVGDFIYLDDDNHTIRVNKTGLFRIQGCAHLVSNLGSTETAKVLVRSVVNGNEQRCVQTSRSKSFQSDTVDTMSFEGTFFAEKGSTVHLQYQVSKTGINLAGDQDFDRPVSFSTDIHKISD